MTSGGGGGANGGRGGGFDDGCGGIGGTPLPPALETLLLGESLPCHFLSHSLSKGVVEERGLALLTVPLLEEALVEE